MSVLKGSDAPYGFVVLPLPLPKANVLAKPAALAGPLKKSAEKNPEAGIINFSKDVCCDDKKLGGSKSDEGSIKSRGSIQDDCKPKNYDYKPKEENCNPKQDSCQPSYDSCDSKPSCAPKIIIDESAGIQAGSQEISFSPPPLVSLIPSGSALFSVPGVVAGEVSNIATAGAFSSILSLPKAASSVSLTIKDNDGSANGIYSGIRAINGSKIFFYPENGATGSNDFIFVGRVGSGSNPNPAGEVAVVLVYGALKNGAGNVTGFNLYTLLFDVPIEHPNTNNFNDGVSISSLIDVTGTYAGGSKSDSDCDDKGGKQKNFSLKNECIPVCILDDGPKIGLELSGTPLDQLIVDETNLAIDDTKSFATAFAAGAFSYGTDGPGSISSSYSLSVGAGSTGLIDVATGRTVVLNISGGVVQGRTSGGGAAGDLLVFTLSVASNGDVTLDQKRALKHPDSTNPDDVISLSNANLIKLTRTDTITDADGDTACAKTSLSIGTSLHFKDDGPSATLLITNEPLASLVVDETNLLANATASFAANFNSATSGYGADGPGSTSPGGYELGTIGGASGLIDVASDHAVKLSLNGTVIEGRTDDSDAFLVFTVSVNLAGDVTLDQIRAVKHPDPNDSNDSVSLIAANLVTLSKTATVVDRDGDTAIAKGSLDIGKSFVFKDDGPTAARPNQELRLGTAVLDESPTTAGQDGVYLATTNLSAAFAGSFAGSYGADGPGTTSFGLTLLPSIPGGGVGSGLFILDPLLVDGKGPEILLIKELDGSVTGQSGLAKVFSISVDALGVVTFAYVNGLNPENIWHPLNPQNDDSQALNTGNGGSLLLTQKITDSDGDSVESAGLNIGIGNVFMIEDDGPKALADANLEIRFEKAVLDESPLPGAGDGLYSTTVALGAAFGSIALADYGTDGPGSSGFALNLTPSAAGGAVGSGLFILDPLAANGKGAEILLVKQLDGSVIGEVGLNQVFRISVDGSGVVTFAYVDGINPDNIWHPLNPNNDDQQSLNTGNRGLLSLVQRLVDADGDWVETANGFNLGAGNVFGIEDDGPKALADANLEIRFEKAVLDESPLPGAGDGLYSTTVALGAAFGSIALADYGTDGPGSSGFALNLTPSAAGGAVGSGLFILDPLAANGKGAEILLVKQLDGSVIGEVGLNQVFRISVDGSGVVTFAYVDGINPDNIWHPLNPNNDDQQSLNTGNSGLLSLVQRLVDADGDWVETANGFNLGAGNVFGIEDDGPKALADANAGGSFEFVPVFLDESPLPLDGGDGVYSISLNLGAAFTNALSIDYGTDGPGSTGFSLNLTPSVVGAPVYSGLYLLDPTDTETIIDPIGQGEQIRLLDIAGTVYGVTGIADAKLFSISVDNLGVVTFQYSDQVDPANIWHPDVLNDDESELLNTGLSGTLRLLQRVVDADGDWVETANGLVIGAGNGFGIQDDGPVLDIQDDGPVLDISAGPVLPTPLVVDETTLGIPATFDFSNLVIENSNVGTDKPGLDIVTTYTLSAVSPLQTNLVATAELTPIFLFLEGGDVVGRAGFGTASPNPTGSLIFRLSLDSSSGLASLTQYLAVVHPIPGDPNEPISTQIGDDQITINVTSTISDSDGDKLSKSASFLIGDSLVFRDDAPFIAPTFASLSLPSVVSSLIVDESSLAINATNDFSGDFPSLAILPGNDGLKSQSVSYALAIDPAGSDSGLKDSATGDAVLLSKSLGGEILGTINSGATVVFKLTVDSIGKVTLDQQRALVHPDALDPNDPVFLTPLKDGKQLISLVKSITTLDRDDDPLTEILSLDLTTALVFRDDGPTAKNDTDALVSGSNDPKSGNVITGAGTTSGALGVDLSGADTPASISAISGAGGTDSTPGNGLSIVGSYGNLNIDTAGNYTYNRTPGSQDNVNDVFTYTLKDSDGDLSTATLTINIPSGPSFIVGSPTGDSNGSSDPWTVTGDGNGIINGSANSDILIGDPGGSSLAPGSTANIVFVLDNSGSMVTTIPFGGSTKTRLRALQDAVIDSLDTLYNSGAANIRVHIDKFSQSAAPVGTFNLTTNSVDSPSELAAAKAAVNSITTDATTNYEAGLQAALNWIVLPQASGGPLSSATLSQLLFISDGEPNYLLNANNISLLLANTSAATTAAAIDSALGLYNPSGTSNDDKVSEVDNIESSTAPAPHVAFTIEAIGINISSGALANLTKIEGSGIAPFPINPDPGADNITTAEDLSTVLGDLVGGSSVADSAGDDVINGGDSVDLIFGDALNSDQLAVDKLISATYPPGSGWDVFAFLEGPGGATKGPGGAQWTRTDTVNYIKANPELVAQESGRSDGNDTIDGGNGDDVIYGQEGSDSITGAVGADRLSGGTGNDIFKYGLLASIASQTGLTASTADVITDFSSGSDKIQTGIVGVVGTNLRNDPGLAGRTFASSLVAANTFFNTAGNQAYNYFYTFDTSAAQTDAYLFFKSGGSLGNCIAGLSLDRKPGTSLQNGDIV